MKLSLIKIITICIIHTSMILAQSDNLNSRLDNLGIFTSGAIEKIVKSSGKGTAIFVMENQLNIEQVGKRNNILVTQLLVGVSSNYTSIIQKENNNYVSILQVGDGNSNTITQNGNNNEAFVNIEGYNNASNITQIGNYNYTIQDIKANSKKYEIAQLGNNNTIQRYDSGLSPKAFIITQKGYGMHLIITDYRIK